MINIIFTVVLGILTYVIYQKFSRRKLPPGPIPLPLIGNLIEVARVGGLPHEALLQLSKKYGDVYSLTIGVVPTVVVCGSENIRNLLKCEDFDNRIEDDWILDRCYGKHIGLFFSKNTFWRDTRRLTVRILKDFGFGKKATMEELIVAEFEEFIPTLDKKMAEEDNTLVVNSSVFSAPMVNIVSSLVFGSRFKLDDPEFLELVEATDKIARSGQLGAVSLLGAYPFLANYFPGITGFNELHGYAVTLLNYFERVVKRHRDAGNYKTSRTNFIDEFLAAIDNNENENGILTDQNLVCVLSDLFVAGSETSSNNTAFAIRHMVQYPEIQEKVYAEIQRVVGKDRMVTSADKSELRYTDATVLEIIRFASVIAFAPRYADKTCKFGHYEIPEGTAIVVHLNSAGREESVWGDPQNFRPERFLNDTGEIVNSEKLLNFGSGKRNCLGEITARTSLFIAISNLIKTFKFESHPKHGVPKSIDLSGYALAPAPFTVQVTNRSD